MAFPENKMFSITQSPEADRQPRAANPLILNPYIPILTLNRKPQIVVSMFISIIPVSLYNGPNTHRGHL